MIGVQVLPRRVREVPVRLLFCQVPYRPACDATIVRVSIMWSSYSVYPIALELRGLDSFSASCRYVGKRLIPGEPATGALTSTPGGCCRPGVWPRFDRDVSQERNHVEDRDDRHSLFCRTGPLF